MIVDEKICGLLLLDPDRVEQTNISRLHLSTRTDAVLGRYKVDVLAERLAEIGLVREIVRIAHYTDASECRDALRACDLVFGCTDDHLGRNLLNRLAHFYLIPVIDLGVLIEPNSSGAYDVFDGRVTVVQPGYPCQVCRKLISSQRMLEEGLRRKDPELFQERRRAGYVMGLPDPSPVVVTFAEHADSVGARTLVNPTRFYDREVASQLLNVLANVQTKEEFYASSIKYPDKTEGRLDDLAANVRRELEEEESRYVAHIKAIATLLSEHVGVEKLRGATDDDIMNLALAPCWDLEKRYSAEGVSEPMLLAAIISSSFLHLAYKFYRARKYLLDAGAVDRLEVDPNDFEDGAIAFHINLLGTRTLVTGDKGTARALNEAVATLRRSMASHNLDFPIGARVLNAGEFAAEAIK